MKGVRVLDWRTSRSRKKSEELLEGAIDIHVHAGPHLVSSPRSVDPVEAAVEARNAGMKAIVFMDVFNMSTGTAWIVNNVVPDFKTYGGIILNTVYGGLNARAVNTALYYGEPAKFVSFGAHSTYHEAVKEGRYEQGSFILLKDQYPKFAEEELSRAIKIPLGPPDKDLQEILEIIAAHPHVYMVTGHVSKDEAIRLCELSKEFGIKKVVISDCATRDMSSQEMAKVISLGAYIEKWLGPTHSSTIPKTHYYVEPEYRSESKRRPPAQPGTAVGVPRVAELIREFGAEHFIIATDFGVYTLPTPVEGMREFIACLMDVGLSDEEIRRVSSINPGHLLDLI
jgi:hypothetical protein